jgi:hypothetical protein
MIYLGFVRNFMLKILLFVSLHESHVGSVDFQTDLDEKSQKSGENAKKQHYLALNAHI